MNTKAISRVSAALNLVLAAVVCWKIMQPPAAAVKLHARQSSVVAPAASPANAELRSPQGESWPPFLWGQIASEDLKVYRDNLRSIGCPELTVREIMLSVINERFGRRRHSLLAGLENRFWDFAMRGEFAGHRRRPVTPEWQQPLEDLAAERLDVINQVLGKGYAGVDTGGHARLESLDQRYAWLPAEKRAKLIALETAQAQKFAEWTQLAMFGGQNTNADSGASFQKLQQDYEEARDKLLTPEEQKELRLHNSDVAEWAGSIPGFDTTEDEWRAMTDARIEYEEARRDKLGADLSDEERSRQQNEIESNFENQLKAALGDDRYADYQRANNDLFQAVYNVTERYGLPEDVAVQTFQIQQAAIAQAEQVRNNSNLSPDEQQAALDAIRQETERALNGKLGDKAFSTYQEYSGSWLTNLGTAE